LHVKQSFGVDIVLKIVICVVPSIMGCHVRSAGEEVEKLVAEVVAGKGEFNHTLVKSGQSVVRGKF